LSSRPLAQPTMWSFLTEVHFSFVLQRKGNEKLFVNRLQLKSTIVCEINTTEYNFYLDGCNLVN